MDYTKPHLSYEEQRRRLEARGLRVDDPVRADATLRRVGYYRFSGYSYPMRELLLPGTPRQSRTQFRSDRFAPGATFEVAEGLWRFDRDLRYLMLDGLTTIEIALRVKVAFTLGRRGPFAHLDEGALDTDACHRPSSDSGQSVYEVWGEKYRSSLARATEDFVTHFMEKYEGQVPIWVATEIMDFGELTRLLSLMKAGDQSTIAREFRVSSGSVLKGWVKVLNYVRNVCAHHGRLWNRKLTYSVARIHPEVVPMLADLRSLSPASRTKIYGVAAIVAHMVRMVCGDDEWALRFVDLARRFPASAFASLEGDMGFPCGWEAHAVWRRQNEDSGRA